MIINNHEFFEIEEKSNKKEIEKIFAVELENQKLYRIKNSFNAHSNNISIIKSELIKFSNISSIFYEKNKIENFFIDFYYSNDIDEQVVDMIKLSSYKIIKFSDFTLNWLVNYFDYIPRNKIISIIFIKNSSKILTCNNGMIYIDISNLSPVIDLIDKNYFIFILINQM